MPVHDGQQQPGPPCKLGCGLWLQSQPLVHLVLVASVVAAMVAMGSYTVFGDRVPALSTYSDAVQDAFLSVGLPTSRPAIILYLLHLCICFGLLACPL